MDIKAMGEDFRLACQAILDQPGLSAELEYRVNKMTDRFMPLVDRVYLKTLKGMETAMLCTEKARGVGGHMHSGEELLYRLLTDLENTLEDLFQTTYEFRIKAG